MTVNELIEAVAKRAGELAEKPIDYLRTSYPLEGDSAADLKRHLKRRGLTRGELIRDIVCEEFFLEDDKECLDASDVLERESDRLIPES